MKNWRTTFLGTALAVAEFMSRFQTNGGTLDDWKLWLVPALLSGLGYLAKDAGVSGTSF